MSSLSLCRGHISLRISVSNCVMSNQALLKPDKWFARLDPSLSQNGLYSYLGMFTAFSSSAGC
jgi:hypothetical protein